jgi:hypothetical protein
MNQVRTPLIRAVAAFIVGILFLLAVEANARPKPGKTWLEDEQNHAAVPKHRVIDKKFIFGAVVPIAVTSFLDGWVTTRIIHRGGIELNPIYGKRPSDHRIYLEGGAVTAGYIGLVYLLKKWDDQEEHKSYAWLLPVGLGSGIETWMVVRNLGVQRDLNHFNAMNNCLKYHTCGPRP